MSTVDDVHSAIGVPPPSTAAAHVMPLAPAQVNRVIVDSLADGFHVTKDSKVALHKIATVFVMYLQSLIAAEKLAAAAGRKQNTIKKRVLVSSADVKRALEDAGMAHLVPQMSLHKRNR